MNSELSKLVSLSQFNSILDAVKTNSEIVSALTKTLSNDSQSISKYLETINNNPDLVPHQKALSDASQSTSQYLKTINSNPELMKLSPSQFSNILNTVIMNSQSISQINEIPNLNHKDKIELKKTEKKINKNKNDLKEMKINILSNRINIEGKNKIRESEDFLEQFCDNRFSTFILSIDIRNSTQLMLNSRDPELFVDFINNIVQYSKDEIKNNYGVFDKFTGDGVLGYFPEFYSGQDAGLLCIKTALNCHSKFKEIYKSHRMAFKVVIKDTGLGIGIDYGEIHILTLQFSDLIIVGEPIVYACRFSNCPANKTYLNQPAYEKIINKYNKKISFDETELKFKNDYNYLAYELKNQEINKEICKPDWIIVN